MKKVMSIFVASVFALSACGGGSGTADTAWGMLSNTEKSDLCAAYTLLSEDEIIDVLTSEPDAIASDLAADFYSVMGTEC